MIEIKPIRECDNGIVYMFRGDSFSMPIKINNGSKLEPSYYHLTDRDTLYFGLMEPNQAFEDAVVKKRFTYISEKDEEGNILLKLDPSDTLNLLVGKYFYMIKLRTINEDGSETVRTILPLTQWFIEGNNVEEVETRYDTGRYDITYITLDGGEIE